ncbi:hypothetical protein GCM10020000_01640 [Streptomyces olivoverticillatus]
MRAVLKARLAASRAVTPWLPMAVSKAPRHSASRWVVRGGARWRSLVSSGAVVRMTRWSWDSPGVKAVRWMTAGASTGSKRR